MRAFRSSQLRIFFQRSYWSETLRSLKRVHKDRRARRQLLLLAGLVAFLLLVVIALTAYIKMLLGTGAIYLVPIVIVVLWWIRHRAQHDFAPMQIAVDPELDAAATATKDADAELLRYFQELAFLYAVLVERAGSERYLKEETLPEGSEVAVRRKHLELLRSHGIWEKLAAADREVLMCPDGTWDVELINRISIGLEPLRLLRWILRIDFWLPSIGQNLYGSYDSAHELVSQPTKIFEETELADISLIRSAREDAALFRLRCRAEEISRGYVQPENEQVAQWAEELSEELKGNQDEDLLLVEKLVSEADPRELSWAWALATMRVEFFDHALALIDSGIAPPPPLASVFAQHASMDA